VRRVVKIKSHRQRSIIAQRWSNKRRAKSGASRSGYYDHEEQSLNITVQRASQREHQPAREEQHHCAAVKRGRSERSKEQQSLNMTELEEHRSGSEKRKKKSKRTAIAEHH